MLWSPRLTAALLALSPVLAGRAAAQQNSLTPAMLGRAYLINQNALRMIAMARQGATLQLQDGDSTVTVTAANAAEAATEYERRGAAFAAAIRARGFTDITGEYELAQPKCPEALDPILITLSQDDFVVSVDGQPMGVVVSGYLVTGEGDGTDNAYREGRVGKQIVLHQFKPSGCATVLTAYRRPRVQLERPEQLIGTWEGRWDETYDVRFTITRTDTSYDIDYRWREHVGDGFSSQLLHAHPATKHSIRAAAIQIFVDGDSLRAEAHFSRTRRAALHRVAAP